MGLPVATRLVVQALRDEAFGMVSDASSTDYGTLRIATALNAVAERVERAGSSVTPRSPSPAPDAPAVSAPDLVPQHTDWEDACVSIHEAVTALKTRYASNGQWGRLPADVREVLIRVYDLSLPD